MTRLRWILAGAIALVAAVASVQALFAYVAHQITVGVLAVLALLGTLVAGLYSLAQARRRIGRELAGLRARPPEGELYRQRVERLSAIAASGARPDPDALADSSTAEEAGRAYIGRYLVATTVLIGLVGTFAGLMETLGKVSPLLSDSGSGGLALLAAPLAGLHVTFGASLVAILATLSLALAQGDLALHEELALARLQDITAHELIPQLWPTLGDGADRTVAAIADLKATFGDAVVRSLEQNAGRMAADSRAESQRAAKALEAAAAAVEKQVGKLCETITLRLGDDSKKQTTALVESATKQSDALGRSAAGVAELVGKSIAAQAAAFEALRSQLAKMLGESSTQHAATLTSTTDTVAREIGLAAGSVLANLRGDLESAVTRTTEAAAAAVRETLSSNEAAIARVTASAEAATNAAAEASRTAARSSGEAAASAIERALAATEAVSASAARAVESASASAAATITKASETAAQVMEEGLTRAATVVEQAATRASAAAEQAATRASTAAQEAAVRASAAAEEAATRATAVAEQSAERATNATDEIAVKGAAAAEEISRRGIEVMQTAITSLTERIATNVAPLFAGESERLEAVRQALETIVAEVAASGARLEATHEAMAALGQSHTSALEETGKAMLAGFDRAVGGGATALDSASGVLAQAAKDLRSGTEGVVPVLRQLGSDLAALGREVALMAARSPESDSNVVLLAELERVGAGVDRLMALQEMASGASTADDGLALPVTDAAAGEAPSEPAAIASEAADVMATSAVDEATSDEIGAADVASEEILAVDLTEEIASFPLESATAISDAETASEATHNAALAVEAEEPAPTKGGSKSKSKRKRRERALAEAAPDVTDASGSLTAAATSTIEASASDDAIVTATGDDLAALGGDAVSGGEPAEGDAWRPADEIAAEEAPDMTTWKPAQGEPMAVDVDDNGDDVQAPRSADTDAFADAGRANNADADVNDSASEAEGQGEEDEGARRSLRPEPQST